MTFSLSYGNSSAMTTSSFNVYSFFVYTKYQKCQQKNKRIEKKENQWKTEAAKATISHRKLVSFYWVCPPNTHTHTHRVTAIDTFTQLAKLASSELIFESFTDSTRFKAQIKVLLWSY